MKNEDWKGTGFCKARHIVEHDDYCNLPVAQRGEYCMGCTCSVRGCRNKWSVLWPLVGNTALCSEHYDNPPAEYSNLVRAANEPPDDFDIPYGE